MKENSKRIRSLRSYGERKKVWNRSQSADIEISRVTGNGIREDNAVSSSQGR
jgi:hypothetical protein